MTTGRRAVRSAARTASRSAGGRAPSAVRRDEPGSRRGRVEVEVDGARRPGQAQRDRRPHVLCGRRRAEDERALRDRTEQRGVVEALVGDAAATRGRHAVADEQEGLAVEQGVRDAVHRAGDTRTAGDDAGARPAAQLGRGRGHEHRRGLGVGEDEAQPLGLGRADDVEVAAAARQRRTGARRPRGGGRRRPAQRSAGSSIPALGRRERRSAGRRPPPLLGSLTPCAADTSSCSHHLSAPIACWGDPA